MTAPGDMPAGPPLNPEARAGVEGLAAAPVVLSARRGQVRRSRTLAPPDAELEAGRLRLEGWTVSIESTSKTRAKKRVQKQRAQVIANHRNARRARQQSDDAVEAKRADDGRTESGGALGPY